MVTTSVMFPFLFGVMFGDIFHGILLFLFGLFLVFANLPGKWLILFAGFFSAYCGLIYNDFNAIPTQLFGKTCWATDKTTGYLDANALPPVEYYNGSGTKTRFATKDP